ncbi:MAG: T9SS type A sorting domain-containing protein [Hymenobacter sp.]|nr:MAG: T9SS type A sorting domain-containing protein [Hymenobacter sp.]
MLAAFATSNKVFAQAATITDDVITLTTQPTGQPSVAGRNFSGSDNNGLYGTTTPLGQSSDNTIAVPQLGTYDLNGTSALTITSSALQGILGSSTTTVSATRLQYRTYLTGTTDAMKPNYTNATLNSSQSGTGSGNIFMGNASMSINVISGLVSGGTYVLDVRFQVDVTRNNSLRTFSDLSGGDYFYANFYVTPPNTTPPGGTTTWQSTTTSGGSTDWSLPANWSNGVPTRFSNAIIPPKAGSTIVYPILNSPTTTYEVNNITLQGNQSSAAAQLTINTATLRVYGNINQVAGGLAGNTTGTVGATDPINNSTLILAGTDQIITGNLVVSDIIVAGSGTKSVINQLTPANILVFQPNNVTDGVVIQSAAQDVSSGTVNTVFDTTGNSYIQLISSSRISLVPGQAETNYSYIKGVTRADRQLIASSSAGTATTIDYNTFGNIGLDMRANHTPGTIVVYRVIGDALTGPLNATAVPVKRQYRVQGDDNSNNTAFSGSTLDVIFHYLDSGPNTNANELNGIDENNLTMFRTVTNGAPYQAVAGILNTANNTVTRTTLNSLSNFTLTLGDRTNPLPVSLIAFAAVRTSNSALLSWTTATEENNKGFNVQVSKDGVNFRTISFVASKLVNSVQTLNYTYTDTENGKTSTRYYRLEQVDVDGKTSYSPVRAVSFDGAVATSVTLVSYPNPFTDNVGLTLEGLTATDGAIAYVKVVDMAGRTVSDQKLPLNGGSLLLGDLGNLHSGLYLVKVILPDGSTKTVRIQRQ